MLHFILVHPLYERARNNCDVPYYHLLCGDEPYLSRAEPIKSSRLMPSWSKRRNSSHVAVMSSMKNSFQQLPYTARCKKEARYTWGWAVVCVSLFVHRSAVSSVFACVSGVYLPLCLFSTASACETLPSSPSISVFPFSLCVCLYLWNSHCV